MKVDYSEKIFQENIQIYNSLLDEESKALYRANMIWRIMGEAEFYKSVAELDAGRDFGWNELMDYEYFNNPDHRGIILFGSGTQGLEFYYQLVTLGYRLLGFCDNNKGRVGTNYLGLEVLSVEQVLQDYQDAFIVVTPCKYGQKIFQQLVSLGFNKDNICVPMTGFACIYNVMREQYFDKNIMKPSDNEVFIDAGAYDGNTVLDFVEWSGGKYKEIYAMEPSPEIMLKCKTNLERNEVCNVHYIQAGCFSSSTTLKFDNSMNTSGAATISTAGEMEIDVVSIDEMLDGKEATFIKMDIEGVELEALKGAKETIRMYKPKLAICIYHKKEDAFTIPNYIKSLRDDYQFYIRKYTPHHGEMVLYAI